MIEIAINERDVAKTTRLDKKSWKVKITIIALFIIIVTSSVLIWGYGFKGFLYLEFKKKTQTHYDSIVMNLDREYIEKSNEFNTYSSQKGIELIDEIEEYYLIEGSFKYIKGYKIETMKSSNKMIYTVTNPTFKDIRENVADDNKLMATTIFIYSLEKEHKVEDILFRNGDMSRLGDYK